MAKQRKRRRRSTAAGGVPAEQGRTVSTPPKPGPSRPEERRARKDEARRAREAARRRAQRSAVLRRTAIFALVGTVAVGAYLFLTRAPGSGQVGDAALRAAEAAGCGDIQTPERPEDARGGLHLDPGEAYSYDQYPATAGSHDPSPMPPEPRVYDRPISETRAVHNLEHGYVIVYYRAEGEGALPEEVVDRLGGLVEPEDEVLMAPHSLLDQDTALAFTAWNKLWECPADVTADQAETMLEGWIRAYRNSGSAPESFA